MKKDNLFYSQLADIPDLPEGIVESVLETKPKVRYLNYLSAAAMVLFVFGGIMIFTSRNDSSELLVGIDEYEYYSGVEYSYEVYDILGDL